MRRTDECGEIALGEIIAYSLAGGIAARLTQSWCRQSAHSTIAALPIGCTLQAKLWPILCSRNAVRLQTHERGFDRFYDGFKCP